MRLKSIMKKSLRSLIRNKGSYFACIIVLALGIAVFIAMLSVLWLLESGVETYYRESAFGDVFATVTGMPKNHLSTLERIEGIKVVEGNLAQTVRAEFGNDDEIIRVKLVGIDSDQEKEINQYRYEGMSLQRSQDIWLGKSFYEIHGLTNGDKISLLIKGKEMSFTIKGTVESPEYISVVPENALLPDDRTYTIGFVDSRYLEAYLGMEGFVTEVSFLLEAGYVFEDVEQMLDERLEKYGLLSLVAREHQISNYYIYEEIGEVTNIGSILPAIFLAVSFIMLYIMLKRLIEQERGQIGTFKAFGFTSREIIAGYFMYSLFVGILGFLLGVILSLPIGSWVYATYQSMYSLPEPKFLLSKSICAWGMMISLAVSTISVLVGANSVLRIRPAEAMRPEAPNLKESSIDYNKRMIRILFNKNGVMALRNIFRSKVRSMLIVLSVVFAFATINVIYAMKIACEDTILNQPKLVELYDIKASLASEAPLTKVINQIEALDGVTASEGILMMTVSLANMNLKETVGLYGISEDTTFMKIRGTNGKYYQPSKEGLILNNTIAEKLQVKAGDKVEIRSPYLKQNVMMTVSQVFEEAMGPGCYLELSVLSELFFHQEVVNCLLIRTDKTMLYQVQSSLKEYPNITDIVNQERNLEVSRQMLESLRAMIYAFIFMSFLVGFGAIYNVSKISLAEKQRELATMRIIGYTIDETVAMNSFEQWLMLFAGILLGFIPAYFLKDFLATIFDSDYYTLKLNISFQSTLVAVLCCVAAVLLANFAAKKEISRYQLVEVLRER